MSKEVVLSGIRPTGYLHLGNYFGAMRNWVNMQENYECLFCVVDWHSLTTHPNTKELQLAVRRVIAENIACGIDPDKSAFYVQSTVPEIAELYLLLNMLAYKGELEKTTTFKDKVRQHPENVNAGLLTYPVLMAADILVHRATKVPVGKDQEQHLEMARNFGERFNYRYGNVFPAPTAFNEGGALVKILSLDGNGKMSKSENQNATIFLTDSDEDITRKIKKAKTATDAGDTNGGRPEHIDNLLNMLRLAGNAHAAQKFTEDFDAGTIRYGDLKGQLAEDLVRFLAPVREKANELLHNDTLLNEVIAKGAAKARERAGETLRVVRDAMGLTYRL